MSLKQLIDRISIGKSKEQLAKHHLLQHNLEFIEQNFGCKLGEIDLIFFESYSNTFVFVEVRYRKSTQFGGAAASVTKTKQQKVKKTALFYLSQRKIEPNIRFDVVAIDGESINWIQSAFS